VMDGDQLREYGEFCAWALANAHARSGDPVAIAGYLGKGDTFDKALVAFSEQYADQSESDYARFVEAVKSDKIPHESLI
jgi:predicted alpha/beta hydrolase